MIGAEARITNLLITKKGWELYSGPIVLDPHKTRASDFISISFFNSNHPSMAMVGCKDIEGWRLVSRLRPFDLTPCAEGLILSTVLVALLATAVVKLWLLSTLENRIRTSKSRWVLRGKLVKFLSVSTRYIMTQTPTNFRRCSCLPSSVAA